MTIPDYQTLMLPLLKLAADKDIRVPEVENEIAQQFGLSDEDRNRILPSGRQRVLNNRLHWAKFYMAKAGLVASTKASRFIATDVGRKLLAQSPSSINNEMLLQYPGFEEFYRGGANNDVKSTATEPDPSAPALASKTTPEEQIESAHLAVQAALRADLLQRILQNSPSFFEQVIVNLLVAMGYGGSHQNAAMQLGKSGDEGVDGVINEDRLGLDRVYIQAKRFSEGTIGRPQVQGFVGSLVGKAATKGVFVTTSSFSPQAVEYAKNLPQRVILIDGQQLTDLMIEHDVGVRVIRAIQFKRIDEDFFSEGD